MARNLSIIAVFVAALALASGTRQPLQAATTPTADVVFLMEAAQATFINATTLALNGLTGSAQSYGAGAKTGIYPISNFTDGSASSQYVDSNGQWLSNPQAVMYGVGQDSNVTIVLLTLSNPTTPQQPAAGTTTNNNNNNNGGSTVTNNNNNGPPQLTFTVALVPADASKVKYQNGVVAEKIAESANGVGNLAQAITPGATFGPVVIYIDQSQQGLPKKATTKWGSGGWGNWGGGYGNGYNNGWNNGWGGSSSNNNNNNNNNGGGWGSSNNNNNNNNNGGGWGSSNNNNNNNNNGGGWGSSNNNNNNNNNGGWGSSNNNNNNNNNGK